MVVDPGEVGLGTHYPNRLFVGSLPGRVNATDLAEFFRTFGTVLEGKVVLDNYGRSRRFGFVTFATPQDVARVLAQGTIFFRGKQINIGPAVKRMLPEGSADKASPSSPLASPLPRRPPPSPQRTEQRHNMCYTPVCHPSPTSPAPSPPLGCQSLVFTMDNQIGQAIYAPALPLPNVNQMGIPCRPPSIKRFWQPMTLPNHKQHQQHQPSYLKKEDNHQVMPFPSYAVKPVPLRVPFMGQGR